MAGTLIISLVVLIIALLLVWKLQQTNDYQTIVEPYIIREDHADEDVKTVARALVPNWQNLTFDQIQLKPLKGGLTNLLWKVSVSPDVNIDRRNVLVRLYGANTDIIIDRKRETYVLQQCSLAGFKVALLSAFKNGRVESWLSGSALTVPQMREDVISVKIAEQVALMHKLELKMSRQPELWKTFDKWIKMCKDISFTDHRQAQLESLNINKIESEVEKIKSILDEYLEPSPVVFAHMDLLSGNIMMDNGNIMLIDFEYSEYSYRGFDIGNHFNEWAGFECEWQYYPTVEQQNRFLESYLKTTNSPSNPEILQKLRVEADMYSLVSNLFWGTWGVLQSKYSAIDFDYLSYANKRFSRYYEVFESNVASAKAIKRQ